MSMMQEKAWEAVKAALSERVKNGPRGELSAIAWQIGATRGTVSRWLSGGLKGRRIPYDKMARIMRVLDLDPAEYFDLNAPTQHFAAQPDVDVLPQEPAVLREQPTLMPCEAAEARDYYHVPWLEDRVPGGGRLMGQKVKSYLSFRRDWLLAKGPIGKLVVVSVQGDGMSPTIPDGSVVLVNELLVTPVNGKIYLLRYRDELLIKRVKVKEGRVIAMISDLDASELPLKKGERCNIIGRAVWYGKEL